MDIRQPLQVMATAILTLVLWVLGIVWHIVKEIMKVVTIKDMEKKSKPLSIHYCLTRKDHQNIGVQEHYMKVKSAETTKKI